MDVLDQNEQQQEIETGDVTVQAQALAVDSASLNPSPSTVGGGKNVVLPRDAFNARLNAATDRGKRAAISEMESQAQANGFSSMQDMFATIAALKSGNKANSSAQRNSPKETDQDAPESRTNSSTRAAAPASTKEQARWAREAERARKEAETERRGRISAERGRKAAEQSRQAIQAEMAIREAAILAGAKDVDYAVTLLRRSIEDKTEAELASFDEAKFFDEMREKQPYLFGEVVRPVTTGTGGKEPPAPRPGVVNQATAQSGQIDAAKMNDKDFREHLRKRGLNVDIAGV
jgi:hypothetical protein